MRTKKTERIPSHPGVYRILTLNSNTGKWTEPKLGAKFRSTRHVVENGVRRKIGRYFDTFAEAKAFHKDVAPLPFKAASTAPVSESMTFRTLCSHWQTDWLPNKDISTQVRYRKYLKFFECFMDMPVENIRPLEIDRWIGLMKSPKNLALGHSTRCGFDHEFTVLRIILNFYTSRFNRSYRLPFISDHKKMLKVREKAIVKKDLNVEDVGKFMTALRDVCQENDCEAVYYLGLMQYAIYSRVQEAAALYYEDFDFERNKLTVKRKIQWLRSKGYPDRIVDGAKTNGGKQIELPDLAKRAFREWVLKSGIRSGLLFRDGETFLTYRQIEHRYSQALKRAGLPFTATHILRHAALSEHYDTCKDLLATQQVAGQRDLRSTTRYAKVRDTKLIQTQQQMDGRQAALLP